jgi:hypothetical protein
MESNKQATSHHRKKVKEEIRSELLLADHRGAWIASFYESRSPKHFPNKGGRLKADSFSRGFQARFVGIRITFDPELNTIVVCPLLGLCKCQGTNSCSRGSAVAGFLNEEAEG